MTTKFKISKAILNDVFNGLVNGDAVLVETKKFIIEVPQSFIDENIEMWGESLQDIASSALGLIMDGADFIYAI